MNDEIDLHGLTVDEACALFVRQYNRRIASGAPLRVIHGYGSSGEGGVIRQTLRKLLDRHKEDLSWWAGESVDGNPGWTLVHPKHRLPTVEDELESAILAYCSTPRTESKIAGEVRRYTAKEVKEAIRRLCQKGKLKEGLKGAHVTYST